MPRPRAFDTDHALTCIRDAFWAHGVQASSMDDLGRASGLSTGSLYKAFGSKALLLERVLDDYLRQGVAWVRAQLDSASTPRAGIEAWLHAIADLASDPSPTRGCFAVQCAAELAEDHPEVRARLRSHDAALRALLESALTRHAERTGQPLPVGAHARLLLTVVNGLQLEARKGITPADAHATVEVALAALDVEPNVPPPSSTTSENAR